MLIGTDYKIESNSLNITLFQRTIIKENLTNQGRTPNPENIGKDRWIPLAYFSNLKAALRFLVKYDIQGMGLENLASVSKRQDELYDLISSLTL